MKTENLKIKQFKLIIKTKIFILIIKILLNQTTQLSFFKWNNTTFATLKPSLIVCDCFCVCIGARQRNTPILFNDADGPGTGVYGKVRKAASTIDRFR